MPSQRPNDSFPHENGSSYEAAGKDEVVITMQGVILNPSGHKDQLQRHYGLLSICGMALTRKMIVPASTIRLTSVGSRQCLGCNRDISEHQHW